MTDRELLQQALDALEMTRSSSVLMRTHAEEYGLRWARAYVREYREITPGSGEEKFRALNELHRRLDQYALAIAKSYDVITAIRTHLDTADAQIAAQKCNGATK